MNVNAGRKLAAVLVVAWVAAGALGQVAQTDYGRALDANYQVGSGGINTAVRSGVINSQLYVNGQVRGLAGFRGGVGYFPGNELSLNVPSARLDTFYGQSVGLADVLAGQTYLPSPYYRPSQTVLSAGAIARRLNRPGTSAPREDAVLPQAVRELYNDVTADYRPLGTLPPGRALSGVELIEPLVPQVPSVPRRIVAVPPLLVRETTDTTFGLIDPDASLALAREIYEVSTEDRAVQAQRDQAVDATAQPLVMLPEDQTPGGEQQEPSAQLGQTRGGPYASLPSADKEVMVDLLLRLRQQQEAQGLPVPPEPAPGTTPPGMLIPGMPGAPGDEEETEGAQQPRAVTLTGQNRVVIHSLAGKSEDMFNRYLQDAERKLRAGEYYRAAAMYELAMVLRPNHALARCGMGMAFLGAGEPMTAAAHFRNALRLFPPLMSVRLDVDKMMDLSVVLKRTADVEARLVGLGPEDTPDAMLSFLACFVHCNLGDSDAAKTYARKLNRSGTEDKILQAYATFILTGKRPGETKDENE